MNLTREEEAMLNGAHGEVVAEAMDYLVQFGDAFDAERMVDVVYCHHPAEMAIYRGEIDEICELADRGARVAVPTTSSTLCYDLDQPEATGIPEELAGDQRRVVEPHRCMGIAATYTCTPYLLGYIPPKGAYIATVESSAIIYYNSVLGCRTNRGGTFTRYSAITGKYPYMGYLLDENRRGTHRVRVEVPPEGLQCPLDFSLLGFCVGEVVGSEVPVFDVHDPAGYGTAFARQENLIALGAALATSGSVTVYHIPGVTAEMKTVQEAFGGQAPREEMVVTREELDRVRLDLTTAIDDEVDFVLLGCPHYNLEQLRVVAGLLDGKRVHENVRFWICTPRMIKLAAAWDGYLAPIERAGAKVIADTCAVESHMRMSTCVEYGLPVPQINTMVTDSTKQARYVKDLIGCRTVLADMEACVTAAMEGRWRA
jgi:predicted aconitase